MRKLKFRAWVSSMEHLYSWDEMLCFDLNHYFELQQTDDGEDVELMQYTGLKDKNGVDIYEGDVLNDGAVVEWFDGLNWDGGGSVHSGFYCKKWMQYPGDDQELSYHDGFDDEQLEVIGNIYENKELLK